MPPSIQFKSFCMLGVQTINTNRPCEKCTITEGTGLERLDRRYTTEEILDGMEPVVSTWFRERFD